MTRDDIITVDITPEMVTKARKDALFLRSKVSERTVDLNKDRDVIGSLAHQIVEEKLDELGLYYNSTREIHYKGGDEYDIGYEGDLIDIKGFTGVPDGYILTRNFLVMKRQLVKDTISHFLFCLIEPEYTQGWIVGLITMEELIHQQFEVYTYHENLAVRTKDLQPFLSYVFRTPY